MPVSWSTLEGVRSGATLADMQNGVMLPVTLYWADPSGLARLQAVTTAQNSRLLLDQGVNSERTRIVSTLI
jgi:hypothetical protein